MTKWIALAAGALMLAGLTACDTDAVIDEATGRAEQAADDLIAERLSTLIADNSPLTDSEADCVAGHIVEEVGTETIVNVVLATGGDLSQVSEEDRQRVIDAVRAAGEACDVNTDDILR